jgi:hypothetical protein
MLATRILLALPLLASQLIADTMLLVLPVPSLLKT